MTHKFLKKKENFHFPASYSKKDALRAIKSARIDLVFLDYICIDYENILKYGFHTLNRGLGFYEDYSPWL